MTCCPGGRLLCRVESDAMMSRHSRSLLMTHAARGRAAYRRLLRAVDTHITAVGGNTTWREAVRDRFRAAAGDRDTAAVEEAVRRAEDLAFLVNSVNDHKARAPRR